MGRIHNHERLMAMATLVIGLVVAAQTARAQKKPVTPEAKVSKSDSSAATKAASPTEAVRQPTAGKPASKRESTPAGRDAKTEAALGGYCPVAYMLPAVAAPSGQPSGPTNQPAPVVSVGKAVKGDPKHTVSYLGEVYYFSSAKAKVAFEEDPEKFAPQFGGLCTTALGGSYGNRIASDPTVFDVYEDKLYLFSSERAKRAYDKRKRWFLSRAEEVYSVPALSGYCPVSYQRRGRAMKGREATAQAYRGWIYRFLTTEFRQAFLADPEKYLPQYEGFCAEGVSNGRRYPADPAHFAVYGGKTYLMFDAKSKMKFLTNRAAHIEKADESWRTTGRTGKK